VALSGRSSFSGRESPAARAAVAPLYKRLPRGPHRLERHEVIHHQRARIHGAMVEAVARSGYEGTSVKQVIGLAGVSRRSFYELFANRQECFLSTFDVIVSRDIRPIGNDYLSATGTMQDRAGAAFERFARWIEDDRNSAALVLLEAPKAGRAGVRRLRSATGACERTLAQSFVESARSAPPATPILRGIAGGLHGMACASLHEGPALGGHELADAMLRWTLVFGGPHARGMDERMASALSIRMRELSFARRERSASAAGVCPDERTRLLQAVLRLAAREDHHQLTGPQIADEANVSIDAFCDSFAGRTECFHAALDMIGQQLLAIAAIPELTCRDWPRAVRRALARLMRHLADNPLHACTLTQEAYFAGAGALGRTAELARNLVTLLTHGAPTDAQHRLTPAAIAGAIWHSIRCQVVAGRIQLLAALSDHLAYVVLAPYIGAGAAAEIVTEAPPPTVDACG
jgi:AcrR family transcriptional regulator